MDPLSAQLAYYYSLSNTRYLTVSVGVAFRKNRPSKPQPNQQAQSDRLYNSSLIAPSEWIQMAIDDLNQFLELFPDHHHAQNVRQRLQEALEDS